MGRDDGATSQQRLGVAGPSHLSLDASADGKRVLAGGYMGCLLLGVDGSHLTVDHGNHVFNVKFHPNGQSFATACYDGKSRLWSVRDPLAVSPPVFIPQFSTITGVVFSEDGSKLVGHGQNHVVVWERAQSAIVGKLAWKESLWRPRPSFDGRLVAPGVWHFGITSPSPRGNTLSVMRMNDGQPAGPTIALDGLQVDSCVCSDNRSVAVITAKGTTGLLSIFDVASGKLRVPTVTFSEVPLSMAARPEHSDVAVLCPDGSLRVIDSTTGSTRLTLSHDAPAGHAITARVVYTADGQTLVTLLSNHHVHARDVDSGELRFPPINPITQDEDCRAITLSKDGRLLATVVAGSKNVAQVWDLTTGRPVGSSMPHPGDEFGLWAVAFSPDGQRLVTGHKDGQARIWDWRTGQLVGTPMQHPGEIYDVCFTADGRHLVTCVRANPLHVWVFRSAKERSGQNDLNPKPSQTERPFAERKATMADSPITLLLLAKAHQQRGETDVAKAVLKDLIETLQQQPLPRLLHGPFLEVASEIGGHARYEFAALLAPPSQREQLVPSGLHMFCWRLVGLGEWQAASQVALLEVAATPSNRSFWQHAAALLVLVKDEAGYRDLCQRMLQYIDKLPPPTPEQVRSRAESICKVTSLMPSELNRPPLPVKPLIEFVDKNPNDRNLLSWYCAALSLTTYRDGDFKQSAIWAEKSLTHSQRKGDAGALALVVLSMAQHQLKEPEAARKSLAEATALIPASLAIDGRQKISGPFPVPTAVISGDWLITEALRREASLLIHQKSAR